MIDEKIYQEYNQWKEDNKDIINFLYDNDSLLLVRFDYILEVLDYFFDKLIDDPTYTENEHDIFVTGFLYMKNQFAMLNELLEQAYQKDLVQLNDQAIGLNFLLNIIDLENDLLDDEQIKEEDLEDLTTLKNEVMIQINQMKGLEDQYYSDLDTIAERLIKKATNYVSIHEVFLEVANHLELI